MRYRIVDDGFVPADTTRFTTLRKLAFFTEFDDIELWEVMRISNWRTVGERVALMRERDADQRFGVVIDGEVKVSVDGRRVSRLGVGEVFGELAWLDGADHRHLTTVISVLPTTYLEVNPAALALATDEVRERFRSLIATIVVKRLGAATREIARAGEPALIPDFTATTGLDLQLIED